MGYLRNRIVRSGMLSTLDGSAGSVGGEPQDSFFTTVQKLIPGEAATIFPVGLTLIGRIPDGSAIAFLWAWAVLAITILLRYEQTKRDGINPQWLAVFVSAVSFVLFVYALDQSLLPAKLDPSYHPLVSLGLVVWSIIAPVIYRLWIQRRR